MGLRHPLLRSVAPLSSPTRRGFRSAALAALLGGAIVVGSGGAAHARQPKIDPWAWADQDAAKTAQTGAPTPGPEVAATEGAPTGGREVPTAGGTSSEESALAPVTAPPVDPCALLTSADFAATKNAPNVEVGHLGEQACGFRNRGDTLRVALGVSRPVAGQTSVPPGVRPRPVSGIGENASWLPRSRHGQSARLLVHRGAYELVVEVSTRTQLADKRMRALATSAAASALGRLPA